MDLLTTFLSVTENTNISVIEFNQLMIKAFIYSIYLLALHATRLVSGLTVTNIWPLEVEILLPSTTENTQTN